MIARLLTRLASAINELQDLRKLISSFVSFPLTIDLENSIYVNPQPLDLACKQINNV